MATATNTVDAVCDFAVQFWDNNDGIANLDEVLEKYKSVADVKFIFAAGTSKIFSLLHKNDNQETDYLLEIIPFIKKIEKLHIQLTYVRKDTLDQLTAGCDRLKKIILQLPSGTACSAIGKLLKANPELRTLNLRNHQCPDTDYNISGLCLQVLFLTCLNKLILYSCEIPPVGLVPTLLNLSSLKKLKMINCRKVPSNFPICIIDVCHGLEQFHYHSSCYETADPYELEESLKSNTSSLTKFRSFFNLLLNDEFLEYIAYTCINLSELSFGNLIGCNPSFTETGLAHFEASLNFTAEGLKQVASMTSLQFLELYGITNDNLVEILKPLVNTLKGLTLLREREDFSDVASMFLRKARHLEKLVILGHAIRKIELRVIQRVEKFTNFIKLYLEPGSLDEEDFEDYLEIWNVEVKLMTCKDYCKEAQAIFL